MARVKQAPQPRKDDLSHDDRRLSHLVIMRESSESDHLLMDGMIQQTLAAVPHLPGAQELLLAGMSVFDAPENFGGERRRLGKSNIVLISREDVLYLYSMGSASAKDANDANAFVSELSRIINTFRPRVVTTVSFTRLLRAAEHSGQLLTAMRAHVDVLRCETEIHPATEAGIMMFQVFTLFASSERDAIVKRHTAGRVSQWRRGEWMVRAYPPGYRIVEKKLAVNDSEIGKVQHMLRLLADHNRSPKQIADELGAIGITTPKIQEQYGPDATVVDARNPSECIKTLLSWVDLYEHGKYEVLWSNPFPAMQTIAGIEVDRDVDPEEFPHGVLRFPCEVPLPEEGWGSDETFRSIRSRLTRKKEVGPQTHLHRPALIGIFEWSDGAHEYKVLARNKNYELVRRPLKARKFGGWTADRSDHERLATFNRKDLHQAVFDAIRSATAHGLPADLDCTRTLSFADPRPINLAETKLRSLRQRRIEVDALRLRSIRNANHADEITAQQFIETAERHNTELTSIDDEIAQLEEHTTPTLGYEFDTAVELVINALRHLDKSGASVDAAVQNALRTILSHGKISPDHGRTFRIEFCLDLPHVDGVVQLGPITCTTIDRSRRSSVEVQTERQTKTALIHSLEEHGYSRHASTIAAQCPNPELHRALLGHDLDGFEKWGEHTRNVYRSEMFSWDRYRWRIDSNRQQVLDAIRSFGGSATIAQLASHGFSRHHVRYLCRQLNTPTGQPVLSTAGHGSHRRYGLLNCPTCGGHCSISIVTPETQPGVICERCFTTPDGLHVPAFYTYPAGPSGGSATPSSN